MSWVILILRVIGWLLLSILGLLVLSILLVLFVPIRYRMEGSYYEKPDLDVRLGWLLGLVSIVVQFREGKLFYAVKFLGILIRGTDYRPKEKKKKPPKVKNNKKADKPVNRVPTKDEYTLEGFDEPTNQTIPSETVSYDDNQDKTDYTEKEKQSFFGKLKEFFGKLLDLLRNFEVKIAALGRKLRGILNNVTYYLKLITDEHVQEVLKNAIGLFANEVRKMAPKKIIGKVHFGFEEPDTTGKVLGVFAILFPIFAGKISIQPEFEQSVFECELFMKGRFYIISVLICAWKLYFNKELKKVIKAFQKEEQ